MEAKDTVMGDIELKGRFNVGRVGLGAWLREVLEAQAETSFRAGRQSILEELLAWAIEVKKEYSDKKQKQATIKPLDVQNQAVLGGKIKAFQQVIDKLRSKQ